MARVNIPNVGRIQPDSIAGLVGWWKADANVYSDAGTTLATNGDRVQQWNDQSSSANNVIQSTAGNKPQYVTDVINGKPGILFSNSRNDRIAVASNASLNPTSAVSMIAVIIPKNIKLGSSVQGVAMKADDGTFANPPYGLELGAGTPPHTFRFFLLSSAPVAFVPLGGGIENRKPFIVSMVHSTSSHQIFTNGTSVGLDTGTLTTLATTTGEFHIGAQKTAFYSTRCFDGYVLEVILYKNVALTSDQRKGIEAYLAYKYGISTADSRSKAFSRISTR